MYIVALLLALASSSRADENRAGKGSPEPAELSGRDAELLTRVQKLEEEPKPEYFVPVEKVYNKLISPKGAVNLAVGTASAYLASDALLRKRGFTEPAPSLAASASAAG